MPKIVDTTFPLQRQGQRTHFARTKNALELNIPQNQDSEFKGNTRFYNNARFSAFRL